MSRTWLTGLLTAFLVVAGCQSIRGPEGAAQPHKQWNHVRGRVKLQLAEQLLAAGEIQQASDTATESITLDATQPGAYAVQVRACLGMGRLASAMRVLDAARAVDLETAELYYLSGVVAEQQGDYETALAQFVEASRLEPGNASHLNAQAECLVELDRPDEALAVLRDHARVDDEASVAALRAHIAALVGDASAASASFGRAIATGGETPLVAEEMGRLMMRESRFAEALGLLRPLLDKAGTDSRGSLCRAVAACQLALDRPAAARDVLADYAAAHPRDLVAQLLLAKAAVATDDLVTAMRAIDLIERHEPNRPELWLVRAAVHWRRGKLVAAAGDLYDVLQNDPLDVDAHCLLAEVLREQANFDAARTHFREALEVDPDCGWAREGLRSLERAKRSDATPPTARLTAAVTTNAPVELPR